MLHISDQHIRSLNISPQQAMNWVREAFMLKASSYLPHKTSIPWEDHFMNTMPAVIPELGVMGVKIVSRFSQRTPTIDGHILLYSYHTGELLGVLDAAWITAMRTGAVCATAISTLAVPEFSTIGIMGLGATARTSLECLIASCPGRALHVKLLKYKEQHTNFAQHFSEYSQVEFEMCDDIKSLVTASDVIVSCITYAAKDVALPEWFQEGCLLVPVHTRGFQACDLVFDKVFADDTAHVCHFQNFEHFRNFGELAQVMDDKIPGRESSSERILSYNIGIALHDLVYAKHITDLVHDNFKN